MAQKPQEISAAPRHIAEPISPFHQRKAGLHDNDGKVKRSALRASLDAYKKSLLSEPWIDRKGHTLTFIGLIIFTILLFYRPQDISPSLEWLNAAAFPVAVATLAVFIPTQFYLENRPTIWTKEIKLFLAFIALALLTIPISKNPSVSFEGVKDGLSRIVLIFILFVNALRDQKRWNVLTILLIGVGIMLSYQTIGLYQKGVFNTEGYRVSTGVGMLGNPNEMSLFLALIIPLALSLGFASKSSLLKVFSLIVSGFLGVAVLLTQSRTGFLGMAVVAIIMIWKLGKKDRFKVFFIGAIFGISILLFAPGNYGKRVLSIFDSSLDPAGSSVERGDLLKRSIIVSIRNPWGVGFGNSPSFGYRNLETHNSYTQVSSELGILGLSIYLAMLITPLVGLNKIEKLTYNNDSTWKPHVLAIGLQASIGGYMVTSFFASVAYQWYIYYVIILAIGLRRIFALELLRDTPQTPQLVGDTK